MKLEPRGKYPGVKIHLDQEETAEILSACGIGGTAFGVVDPSVAIKFTGRLGKKLHALIKEHPSLLEDRTPDQIKAELELELEKAQTKLAKMAKGEQWNQT